MESDYQLGLLCFVHLLIKVDGIMDVSEVEALNRIKSVEKISEAALHEFEEFIKAKSDNDIYQYGLSRLRKCSEIEKLRVFAILYKLSEIDGRVDSKEIRLLLYSVKMAGVEFNQVVDFAKSNPTIF